MNFPITVDDINRAEKIYGPNITALKGKTVRSKPEVVKTDYVNVPRSILENNSTTALAADISVVNKIPFFALISRNVKFTTAEFLHRRYMDTAVSCIKNIKK